MVARKSTTLNRIQWFCNNWERPQTEVAESRWPHGKRPVLVRFDLGTAFDSKLFTINLMSEICDHARRQAESTPIAWPRPHPNWARFLVGHVGRWCESNILWVGIVLALGGVFSAIANLQAVGPIDEKTAAIASGCLVLALSILAVGGFYKCARSVAEKHPERRRNNSPWYVFGWVLFPALLVFAAWWFRGCRENHYKGTYAPIVHPSDPRVFPSWDAARGAAASALSNAAQPATTITSTTQKVAIEPSTVPAVTTKTNATQTVSIAPAPSNPRLRPATTQEAADLETRIHADADDLWNRSMSNTKLRQRLVTSGWFVTVLWLVFVLSFCVALFFLPTWWWTYVYCATLGDVLRAKQQQGNESALELPYFSGISAMVRALLPRPGGLLDIRDMDAPFLHEQMKHLIRRCATDLAGLVILIDDVDLLPSEQFAALFQVLRPISKEHNVRCVVSVPLYFYYAMKSGVLNDLHSTVQECWLVGNDALDAATCPEAVAEMIANEPSAAQRAEVLQQVLFSLVQPLLRSRCRLRFSDNQYKQSIHQVVDFMLDRWKFKDAAAAARTAVVVRQFGSSRREILRETRRLLTDVGGDPFSDHTEDSAENDMAQLRLQRDQYRASETILFADPTKRD